MTTVPLPDGSQFPASQDYRTNRETFRDWLTARRRLHLNAARSNAEACDWQIGHIHVCPACGKTVYLAVAAGRPKCPCNDDPSVMLRLPPADHPLWTDTDWDGGSE